MAARLVSPLGVGARVGARAGSARVAIATVVAAAIAAAPGCGGARQRSGAGDAETAGAAPPDHGAAPAVSVGAVATPADSDSTRGAPGADTTDAGPASLPIAEEATLELERVIEEPIEAVALGERRRAALGAEPWLFDGEWRRAPVPARLRPPPGERHVSVFFGRDDRPRLMGYVVTERGPDAVYLRLRAEGWQTEWPELGALGTRRGALFGVLGHADPEVVCAAGDQCIIKRRTGWQTIAGPARAAIAVELSPIEPRRAALLADEGVSLLGEAGWEPAPPHGLGAPSALALDGEGRAWVASAADDTLHVLSDGWRTMPSPVAGPRTLLALSDNDVWVGGDGGAAHFDGARWTRERGVPGPVRDLAAEPGWLWFATDQGLWRAPR